MKILVIEDSVVYRVAIKTALLDSDVISDVDTASNGNIGVQKIQSNTYDGVCLDLEMPVLDGIGTIKAIREFDKEIPIIIFSAQNIKAANKTFAALELGANDFIKKIENGFDVNENLKQIENELVPRFQALLGRKKNNTLLPKGLIKALDTQQAYRKGRKPDIICIGSSTGGPDTIKKIFQNLKNEISIPILLTQHMPPIFTKQFAESLDKNCSLTVVEAKDGDKIQNGWCYVAPGDYHMTLVNKEGRYFIKLNQDEKVCFVRPSVDVMLDSVVNNFRGKIASFILTGMGSDGAIGSQSVKSNDGIVVIQDESSSIVWGMPKSVYELDIYDDIVDLESISGVINDIT